MKKLIVALVLSISGAAFAGPLTQREERQQARIAQGIKTGALTPGEAARLERREGRIEGRRRHRRGRRHLNRALNRQSRAIRRAKHNRIRASF